MIEQASRPPLILTVALDPASQARFDALRQRHFPSEINYLHAHVTMFHHLPGEQEGFVAARLAEMCRGQAASPFTVTGLRFLGRGSAYTLAMPAIAALRHRLAAAWDGWLRPQDRQPWKPHVTVQNKVAPAAAKLTYEMLGADIAPVGGMAVGLDLWAYLGGPWRAVARFAFTSEVEPAA